jgi:HEAT repeat protein
MFGPDVGEAAEAALIKTLADDDKAVALSAASCLALIDPAKAKEMVLPTLIEGLRSPYPQFRRAAAVALGQLGPAAREAARALTEALGDTDVHVHTEAARALMAVAR